MGKNIQHSHSLMTIRNGQKLPVLHSHKYSVVPEGLGNELWLTTILTWATSPVTPQRGAPPAPARELFVSYIRVSYKRSVYFIFFKTRRRTEFLIRPVTLRMMPYMSARWLHCAIVHAQPTILFSIGRGVGSRNERSRCR